MNRALRRYHNHVAAVLLEHLLILFTNKFFVEQKRLNLLAQYGVHLLAYRILIGEK